MVIVLLIDLGLAAAGAVLLSKGLASDSDAQATPVPTEKKSETGTTSPEATATAAPAAEAAVVEPASAAPMISAVPAPAVSAAASAAAASSVPAARKDTAKQRDDKSIRTSSKSTKTAKAAATTATPAARSSARASDAPVTRPSETSSSDPRPVTAVPSEPQDPYEAPDTAREIERLAGRSAASFQRCESNFGRAHGTIQIAFQVKPDGRVANAAAVENSTGNTDLANCLVTVVSSWRVSAHHGDAINMVRPFTYP